MKTLIERKTEYKFKYGLLEVYDTNTPCRDLKFEFDNFKISMMVAGHKTIITENIKLEFFPDFIYIPEKEMIHNVDIPNATLDNPTKCYLLQVNPEYLEQFYFDLLNRNDSYKAEISNDMTHFITNDTKITQVFRRLGEHLETKIGLLEDDIHECMLREILIRLFQTDAKNLVIQNFQEHKNDKSIEKALHFIKHNISNTIGIDDLTSVSGLGKTTFFKRFQDCMGMSPITYITNERIELSLSLIKKYDRLQRVAYESGFNSYEHFYKTFKKVKGVSPKKYRNDVLIP